MFRSANGWVQATLVSGDATFINLASASDMRWQSDATLVHWRGSGEENAVKVLESPELLLERLVEQEREDA